MVNTVIFDLDGTLLNRDKSIYNFAGNQYERLAEHSQGSLRLQIY